MTPPLSPTITLSWNLGSSTLRALYPSCFMQYNLLLHCLLGVQTTLESPFRTADPSLAKVNVQLNLFFPDFTDALTTSLSAETQDNANKMNPKKIMIVSVELLM